jgi:hypothetical protein
MFFGLNGILTDTGKPNVVGMMEFKTAQRLRSDVRKRLNTFNNGSY